MGRTVAELEQVLSHSELLEWAAFYQLEPWGCETDDQRWRQHYNLTWCAHFKGDAPPFLDRNPQPVALMDPFQVFLESRVERAGEQGDVDPE